MAPLLKASLNSQENLKRINPRSSLAMKGPTHDDLVLPCHRFSQDAASDRLGFARGGAGAACRNKISESSGVFGTVITVFVVGGAVNHHRWLVDRHGQRNWQQLLDNTGPA